MSSTPIAVVFGRTDVVWIPYLVAAPPSSKRSLRPWNNLGIAFGSLVHHWRSRWCFVSVRYRTRKKVPDTKSPCVRHPTNVPSRAASRRSAVLVPNGMLDVSYCKMIWPSTSYGRDIMMDRSAVQDLVLMHLSLSNLVPMENKIVPIHSFVWKCRYRMKRFVRECV